MSDTVFIIMEKSEHSLETAVQRAFAGNGGENIGWTNAESKLWKRVAESSTKLKVISSDEFDKGRHKRAFYLITVPSGNDFPSPVLLNLIPKTTLEKLRAAKTPIIISMALEYWPVYNVMSDVLIQFSAIISQLNNLGLNGHRVLLFTLSKLTADVIEGAEKAFNYQISHRYVPLAVEWVRFSLQDSAITPLTLKEAIFPAKPKIFLSLNSYARLNRIFFVNMAAMYDVLNTGLVSFKPPQNIPPLNSNKRYTIADDFCETAEFDMSKNLPAFLNDVGRIDKRLKIPGDILESSTCDENGINLNWEINRAHYTETFFSVVTETYCRNNVNGEDNTIITEKILKAIAMRHPFMVMGEPYTLRLLKSLGFVTYEELFDESYDELPNVVDRAAKICENIRSVHLGRHEFTNRLKSVAWKIEHNYRHLMNMNVGDVIADTILIWEEELKAKAT